MNSTAPYCPPEPSAQVASLDNLGRPTGWLERHVRPPGAVAVGIPSPGIIAGGVHGKPQVKHELRNGPPRRCNDRASAGGSAHGHFIDAADEVPRDWSSTHPSLPTRSPMPSKCARFARAMRMSGCLGPKTYSMVESSAVYWSRAAARASATALRRTCWVASGSSSSASVTSRTGR
jgi:hypothetical protein